MHYRMRPVFYPAGAVGVFAEGAPLPDITSRLMSYEQTSTATCGFESMACTFPGTLHEAIFWASQLMAGTVVYGPDAMTAWEGYLSRVEITLGQRQRSIGLDNLANRVRVRYTTYLGTPGVTSSSSDTNSQARYGIKDLVETLPVTGLTGAQQRRDAVLSARKRPKMEPVTRLTTGEGSELTIRLIGAGWYTALDWIVTNNTATSTAVTTTQVSTLLTGYAAVNAFLSTTTRITASGISDTQFIDTDTTYRAAIEHLLAQGNGSQRYAWGVYEDRIFYAAPWAGATPETIAYRGSFGSQARIYGANNNLIMPWSVRPNAMYEETDLLDMAALADQSDGAARHYAERVTFNISADSYSVDLEPAETDALTAQLARYER